VCISGLRTAHTLAIVDLKTLEVTEQIATGPGSGPGAVPWVP
jgi:hypothetical protein